MILYVSDLDGTLAGPDERLSGKTVQIINSMLARGLAFTVATARSMASAARILAPLRLRLPVIYNNGAFIYHPLLGKNLAANFMSAGAVERFLDDCRLRGLSPLVYLVDQQGKNRVYYRGALHPGEKQYINARLAQGDRRFLVVDDLRPAAGEQVYALLVIGDDADLAALTAGRRRDPEIAVHYTRDIYSGAYWLEATDRRGTKQEAVRFLRSYLRTEKVICFGDNLNDVSMFAEADEAYAVANAHELLKSMADGIIGANYEDGVVRFLLQEAEFSRPGVIS